MTISDATPPKPIMRGWLHAGMTPAVIACGVVFMALASSTLGRVGTAVWMAGSVVLFGMSALYHRGHWRPGVQRVLRRFDHANIFVFIAATYTPLGLVLVSGTSRITLLSLLWGVGVAGVAVSLAWPNAPRFVNVALYLLMGWAGVGWMGDFWRAGGPAVVVLILAGGAFYSVGAIIYALKRPDPSPRVFGFHEIFHACTIAAACCHIVAIAFAVLR